MARFGSICGANKVNIGWMERKRASDRFAIQNVIAGKDSADGLWVLEREEGKTP